MMSTGTPDDGDIKRALDKSRDASGEFNLTRAVELLIGECKYNFPPALNVPIIK